MELAESIDCVNWDFGQILTFRKTDSSGVELHSFCLPMYLVG